MCRDYCKNAKPGAAGSKTLKKGRKRMTKDYSVDCDTCSNKCALLTASEGTDESQYLGAKPPLLDDSGNQIYSATCGSDQGLTMGLFYVVRNLRATRLKSTGVLICGVSWP
jgi:hypothetical protein